MPSQGLACAQFRKLSFSSFKKHTFFPGWMFCRNPMNRDLIRSRWPQRHAASFRHIVAKST